MGTLPDPVCPRCKSELPSPEHYPSDKNQPLYGLCFTCGELLVVSQDHTVRTATDQDLSTLEPRFLNFLRQESSRIKALRPS